MLNCDAKELCEQQQKEYWGKLPNGFYKFYTTYNGAYYQITTNIPAIGREFIRGREITRLKDKTILGEEYFYPAGAYGGRILS